MRKELSYEERLEKSNSERKMTYTEFQKKLMQEKLNLYGFEVNICDPEDSNTLFNTNRDMFSSAYIYFKDNLFAHVSPQFNLSYTNNHIEGLYLGRCGKDVLDSINYHNSERGNTECSVKKEGHKTLQSCLDEAEKIRQEAVKFYSI